MNPTTTKHYADAVALEREIAQAVGVGKGVVRLAAARLLWTTLHATVRDPVTVEEAAVAIFAAPVSGAEG